MLQVEKETLRGGKKEKKHISESFSQPSRTVTNESPLRALLGPVLSGNRAPPSRVLIPEPVRVAAAKTVLRLFRGTSQSFSFCLDLLGAKITHYFTPSTFSSVPRSGTQHGGPTECQRRQLVPERGSPASARQQPAAP